ncbi:twin-arginine translocase TatA/TatE family subunit [Komagataeibacter sucrofermentans]|uniref:Sec-independent protein translocase protein TatA n=1 Tax=Komagataeibacter sucrofermentans TaxID=1053551 RepID=A0A318QIB2_9PROT|nr:twin-arginine translocase TatA/TatE family subunit [Komagataeibacter sucrofermentans]PYD79246.1 twin-arginine translocase TatA/TatE family subunit [Komagataeibacter sucrofermentans]GBQ43771.1 Sec-independent protein translocase protein TatA [Komagataeibacter sucrofermentans DSM 15973]
MGSLSWGHWLIVLAVVLVLFGGGGKISSLMGDMARGIKSFKKNMADDEPHEPVASGHLQGPGKEKDATFTEAPQPSTNNVK